MKASNEKFCTKYQMKYKIRLDIAKVGVTAINSVRACMPLCHNASNEIIIKIDVRRINGAKIVL